MKLSIFKNKSTRGRTFAVISAVSVVAVLLINLLVTYFTVFRAFMIDMTPEGLYSLTDTMKRECAFIDELDNDERKVKITFCTDRDVLLASEEIRPTYFMALELENRFDNLEVEVVNVVYDQTAVSKYKPTSLSVIENSDIIVSYGDRYKVVNAESFWVADSDDNLWAYNGEYRMASIIMSVTAKDRPAAYFVTNHGESYYNPENEEMAAGTAAIYDLLDERGLEVHTLDLSKENIPDDCVLLIINNPTADFTYDKDSLDQFEYISEAEKIDRYLVSGHGSVMVSLDGQAQNDDGSEKFPVLKSFLHEWGFDLNSSTVSDSENYIVNGEGTQDKIIGQYDTDTESYGYAIYEDLASIPSAPSMIFNNTGYIECSFDGSDSEPEAGTYSASRNYAPFFFTSATAQATNLRGEVVKKGVMDVAGVTTRLELDSVTAEYKYSYIFCANSRDFFSSDLIGNTSYANYEVVSALVENMARVDEYASLELGGTSHNSPTVGGKTLLNVSMSATDIYEYDPDLGKNVLVLNGLSTGDSVGILIALLIIPVAVAGVGVFVAVRRRFL